MDLTGSCKTAIPTAGALLFFAAAIDATPAVKFRNYLRLRGIESVFESRDLPVGKLAKLSSNEVNLTQNWEAPFYSKGVHGEVWSMDVLKGKVVVAGTVRGVDQTAAKGIAIWDGARWTALDGGLEGRDGYATIHKVYISGESVFALGYSGTLALDGKRFDVVRWNGSEWRGWKLDSNEIIYDVIQWENRILFGTSAGVIESDSSELRQLGSNLHGEIYQFGKKDTELWVAGKFRLGQDSAPHNLARWTGSSWEGLSAPRSALLRDFAWHGNDLFAIETYLAVPSGALDSQVVVKWNGSGWSTPSIASPMYGYSSLESDQQRLLISGWAEGISMLQEWDGNQFQMATAFKNPNESLSDLKMDSSRIFLSGSFVGIDSLRAEGIAAWDGARWEPLSKATKLGPSFGIKGQIPVLASDGRRLYFGGGGILFSGEKPAGGLSSWDGLSLDNLGGGLKTDRGPQPALMKINAFAFAGNNVYVAGAFDSAGTRAARNIASWDGKERKSLGAGYPGTVTDILAVGTELFLSGKPDSAPSPGSNPQLAGQVLGRWDGATWHTFGEGITGSVTQVVSYKGEVHIGGKFILPADSSFCGLAKWDGRNWSPIVLAPKDASPPNLIAATEHQGDLFIAGIFYDYTRNTSYFLAKWNGTQLAPFDSIQLIGGGPQSLVSYQSKLFLSGTVKGRNDRLIYWDGTHWNSVATGENLSVFAMAEFGGDLYFWGNLPNIGGTST
jgi:hypothetical protein